MRTIVLLLALLLSAACQTDHDNRQTATLTPIALKPSDYRDRWLLINYWALWCKPCRIEISELNALALLAPERVAVVGVDYDGHTGAELGDAIATMGITVPTVIQDPSPAFGFQRPVVLPTTYLFNPEGRLVGQLQGPQSLEKLTALIGITSVEDSAQ